MNLKEAFRYQNFLDGALNTVMSYLYDKNNLVEVKQMHHRHDVYAEAQDVEVDVTKKKAFDHPVDNIVEFLVFLTACKEKLTMAISAAKRNGEFDMDAEVSVNALRQRVANTFKHVATVKAEARDAIGQSYRFNVEGNQVAYSYKMEEVTTPVFNKEFVKLLHRTISATADSVSTRADKFIVQTEVDFDPPFSLSYSVEDMLDKFVADKQKETADNE